MTATTIFLSFLLVLFGHANSESQLNDKEQTVLLKLKQHWQNTPSLSHWQNPLSLSHLNSLNSSHHCNWPEITCTSGTVTQLLLQNKNITQTVPPFICDLKNLKVINLSYNFISQEFPKALYNCSKLEDLDLSQNYFNGTIPVDIHRLSGLRHLNLGANSFYGNIPASIGQLTELRTLKLFQCAFNGSFPPEIGNLFKLESLQLTYNVNMTAAELPSSFTELKKLLWITASNLNGEIPDTIGEIEALVHLDFSINNQTGEIPSSLFMPKNLSIVYILRNQLSGEIPQVVEALNIDVIDLSDNKLTGSIPDDFGRLRNMTVLSLFFNQLSGKIPVSIGRLPSLVILKKVFNNSLLGTLLPDFGRYSMLVEFQVADNKLEGNLELYKIEDPKTSALLVIDVQNYFSSMAHPILPNLLRTIQFCRRASIPVIFTRHSHTDGEGGMLAEWWNGDLIMDGTEEAELMPELEKLPEDMVVGKNTYSAFRNTSLEEQLREMGVEEVIVTGVMTNLCCETTAREAFVRGFRVFFSTDATATSDLELHEATLKNLAYGFAYFVDCKRLREGLFGNQRKKIEVHQRVHT